MIIKKIFECTDFDVDSIVQELSKEIDNGFTIDSITTTPVISTYKTINEPFITIELRRKKQTER